MLSSVIHSYYSNVWLTSSQVLTERKSFETVVRSSLLAMVDPRVVSVALGLVLLSSVERLVEEEEGIVLTFKAKETALGLE